MRRFSSGCVTLAMKLPPTSAIVLPSSDLRRVADLIGSTADSGTGDRTVYVASPPAGSGQTPSLHSAATIVTEIAVIAIPMMVLVFVSFWFMLHPLFILLGLWASGIDFRVVEG